MNSRFAGAWLLVSLGYTPLALGEDCAAQIAKRDDCYKAKQLAIQQGKSEYEIGQFACNRHVSLSCIREGNVLQAEPGAEPGPDPRARELKRREAERKRREAELKRQLEEDRKRQEEQAIEQQ